MIDKHEDINLSALSGRGQQGAEHWFGSLNCYDVPRRGVPAWVWLVLIGAGLVIGGLAL